MDIIPARLCFVLPKNTRTQIRLVERSTNRIYDTAKQNSDQLVSRLQSPKLKVIRWETCYKELGISPHLLTLRHPCLYYDYSYLSSDMDIVRLWSLSSFSIFQIVVVSSFCWFVFCSVLPKASKPADVKVPENRNEFVVLI